MNIRAGAFSLPGERSMMKKVEEGMLISLGIKGFDRRGECIGTNHDNRNRRAGE